jgi:hypothetical protein
VRIPVPPALGSTEALTAALRAAFPRYTVTLRAGVPLVGDGLATGVFVKPDGPGHLKTLWAFPSVVTQLLVTLSILAGILPASRAAGDPAAGDPASGDPASRAAGPPASGDPARSEQSGRMTGLPGSIRGRSLFHA